MSKTSIMLRAPLTLAAICLIAAASLATLDQTTRETIAAVRAQAQLMAFTTLLTRQSELALSSDEGIKELALEAIRSQKKVSDSEVVQAMFQMPENLDRGIPDLYILQLAGRGFGGPLEIFAAYRPDGSLYHAVMLANAETPGFGKKAEDPSYMQIFWDHKIESIPTTKQALPPDKLDAVTGSTISFSAISTVLLAGAEWLVAHL